MATKTKKDKEEVIEEVIPEITEEVSIEKAEIKCGFFCKLRIFFYAVIVVFLLIAIVLQNSEYKNKFIEAISVPSQTNTDMGEISRIYDEIGDIRQVLEARVDQDNDIIALSDGLIDLSSRFEVLEQNNLNTIKSKADVALLLGVIERLDRLESKVNEIAKISDQGSLVLSAAMLVKDRALMGGSFVYEYSVLKGLAEGNDELLSYVQELSKFVDEGISSELSLIREFDNIYESIVINDMIEEKAEEENDPTFSEFNKKFGKLLTFKVKKAGQNQELKENEHILDEILYFVQKNELNAAVKELQKDKYQEVISENPAIVSWIEKVRDRERFLAAISKISAYGMGLMKSNYLK